MSQSYKPLAVIHGEVEETCEGMEGKRLGFKHTVESGRYRI